MSVIQKRAASTEQYVAILSDAHADPATSARLFPPEKENFAQILTSDLPQANAEQTCLEWQSQENRRGFKDATPIVSENVKRVEWQFHL